MNELILMLNNYFQDFGNNLTYSINQILPDDTISVNLINNELHITNPNNYGGLVNISVKAEKTNGDKTILVLPINVESCGISCGIPTNFVVTVENNKIIATWDDNVGVDTYVLEYKLQSNPLHINVTPINRNGTLASAEILNLTNGVYDVRLQALCDNVESQFVNRIATIDVIVPTCNPVQSVNINNVTNTQLTVNWTNNYLPTQGYVVRLYKNNVLYTTKYVTNPSATNTIFSINDNPNPLTNGDYYVEILCDCGNGLLSTLLTSNIVTFTTGNFVFTASISGNNNVVVNGSTILSAIQNCNVTPTYQWQVNDGSGWNNIVGEINATLNLTNIQLTQNGYIYRCIVSCGSETVTTNIITLNVSSNCVGLISASILVSPTPNESVGENIVLSAMLNPTNATINTYTWKKDGIIVGNNSNTLNINNGQVSDNGLYTVEVLDSCGDTIVSNGVNITFTQEICTNPTNLMATSITANSFIGSWETTNSNVVNYTVELLDANDVVLSTNTTTQTWYQFSGLNGGTNYKFRITINCSNGTSDSIFSNIVTTGTGCVPVSNVSVTNSGGATPYQGVNDTLTAWISPVSPTPNVTIQFTKNGSNIGASMIFPNNTLTINNPTDADDGLYGCTVLDGCGNTISSMEINLNYIPCPEPCIVNATNVGVTSFEATWGCTSFGNVILRLYDNTNTLLTTVNTTGSSYVFNGLSAGTQYYYTIQTDCGTGGLSGLVSSNTITTNTSCIPITNVLIDPFIPPSNDFVLLQLNATPINFSNPIFYNWKKNNVTVGTSSTLTLDNTSSADNGTYTLTVTDACGNIINSSNDYVHSVCPQTIANITQVTFDPTSAQFTWDANALFGNYNYAIVPTGNTPTSWSSTTNNFVTLTPLNQYTTYDFYLVGNCTSGGTSQQMITTFTTPCGIIPTNLSVTNITNTTATIGWDSVSGAVGYEYCIVPTGNSPTTYNLTSNTTENITGLTVNTTYDLYVRTVCAISLSSGQPNVTSNSNSTTFTTSNSSSCNSLTLVSGLPLPDATVNVLYSQDVIFTGSTPITLGTLNIPTWMSVNVSGNTVTLTGTPTANATNLTVEVPVINCGGNITINETIDVTGGSCTYSDPTGVSVTVVITELTTTLWNIDETVSATAPVGTTLVYERWNGFAWVSDDNNYNYDWSNNPCTTPEDVRWRVKAIGGTCSDSNWVEIDTDTSIAAYCNNI